RDPGRPPSGPHTPLSAERDGNGKSRLARFFVLAVHVLGGLSHGRLSKERAPGAKRPVAFRTKEGPRYPVLSLVPGGRESIASGRDAVTTCCESAIRKARQEPLDRAATSVCCGCGLRPEVEHRRWSCSGARAGRGQV